MIIIGRDTNILMRKLKILITGGAGFVGSHLANRLYAMGHHVSVIDNLSCGFRDSLFSGIPFYQIDLADSAGIQVAKAEQVFQSHGPFQAVFHLASLISVKESCEKPELYFRNNLESLKTILELCKKFQSYNFIMASSGSIYGYQKNLLPFSEDVKPNPISPYSESKLQCEYILKSFHHDPKFTSIILRYSNVAGSALNLNNGQRTAVPYHVFHRASMTQVGIFPHNTVFGYDYPTHDGTAVRDFIHIEDLVTLNTCAMNYLLEQNSPLEIPIINAGANFPMSVLNVFNTVNSLFHSRFGQKEIHFANRRLGDPAYLVSDSQLARKILGFFPEWTNGHNITTSSVLWLQKFHQKNNSSSLEPSL